MKKISKKHIQRIKEFLKPTKGKMLFFILLMIVISLYSCWQFFSAGCLPGCKVLSDGNLKCPPCPLCHASDLLPFSLGLVIPIYLVVCFLVYIGRRIKNKRIKK